jgi:hypothetical protein
MWNFHTAHYYVNIDMHELMYVYIWSHIHRTHQWNCFGKCCYSTHILFAIYGSKGSIQLIVVVSSIDVAGYLKCLCLHIHVNKRSVVTAVVYFWCLCTSCCGLDLCMLVVVKRVLMIPYDCFIISKLYKSTVLYSVVPLRQQPYKLCELIYFWHQPVTCPGVRDR